MDKAVNFTKSRNMREFYLLVIHELRGVVIPQVRAFTALTNEESYKPEVTFFPCRFLSESRYSKKLICSNSVFSSKRAR